MYWGEVFYRGDQIDRIGEMEVYYQAGRIDRIGNMEVYYRGDRIDRIGNLEVRYRGDQIDTIGDMEVYYRGDRIDRIGDEEMSTTENISFVDYVARMSTSLGFPTPEMVSDSMVSLEIYTQGMEPNPVNEKIFIELGDRDFANNRIIKFSSLRSRLTFSVETFGLLMLRENNGSLYSHWAIEVNGEDQYMVAVAVANTNILDATFMMEIIASILRMRVNFRRTLEHIKNLTIDSVRNS